MGKIRNKTRLHAKPVKGPGVQSKLQGQEMDTDTSQTAPRMAAPVGGGVFSKLDIDISALQSRLSADGADDTRSSVSNKSLRSLNLNKKERQKLRHDIWMKKVDTVTQAKQALKEKKKRQKTVIVGDMKPLEDTLPTLELLLKDTQKAAAEAARPKPKKSKAIQKEKLKQKQMNEDIAVFRQVLAHPTYRENPLDTIRTHLKTRAEMEDS